MHCSFYQQKRSQPQQGRQQITAWTQSIGATPGTPPTAETSAESTAAADDETTAQATAVILGAPSTGSQMSLSGIGIKVTGTAGHELFRHSPALLLT